MRTAEEIAQSVMTGSLARGVYAKEGDFSDYGIAVTAARLALERCVCPTYADGSTMTSHCPLHASQDPCERMSLITGRRRKGTIKGGVCTNCGWKS